MTSLGPKGATICPSESLKHDHAHLSRVLIICSLLEIYAFTERFAAEGLRKKTEAKFYYLARKRAKSEEFLPAIKKAFEIAAEGPTGQGLRNAAVRATAMNIKDVYKAHANFHQVMSNIPHFSSQLFGLSAVQIHASLPTPKWTTVLLARNVARLGITALRRQWRKR